ncbi:hypothetical protein L6164_029798 [Bauhinia variegata]|uniref:Uncharacterized protein n=1 Tax=Bauhinia variegata TaxID=167791 RepID=A0ACB9LAE9_BAUVA|nr:hypothetical protein L6164_029798 [Bauhinia variegata]
MLMSGTTDNLSAEKSFRIKQDDRFFSRLMSKETSMANASSRVMYYGESSVAVPFVWESQPGTPKHPLSETSLPPLTPPPSYYSNSKSRTKSSNSKSNLLSAILPLFSCSRKAHVSPSSSRSSSSSSSTSSSWSAAYSSPSFSLREKWQESISLSRSWSLVSTNKRKSSSGLRGCYPLWKLNIKNAFGQA